MSYFKVSYFLENTDIPPFVLGAFFSRSIFKGGYIYTEASSKAGKNPSKETLENFVNNKPKYLEKLNKVSYPFTWELANTSSGVFIARLKIENDLGLSKERFFYKLYYNTINNFPWMNDKNLNDQQKCFIRGFIETRGSIDTNRPLVAQDYFFDDIFESKKYKVLTDFCNVPYYVLNLNFRDLQKQYYEGVKPRNTQFRLNSKWYMKNIGMIDDFKVNKFAESHSSHSQIIKDDLVSSFDLVEPDYDLNNGVDDRFNFYLHNILNKSLTPQEIHMLRQNLGYDSSSDSLRDSSLSDLVRKLDPDECVACKNLYDLKDRTFTHKKTNKPYFEIHHVISLGNDKELDDENNLVKLCPVCHGCLKRGTGLESEQKEIIKRILENSPKAFNFSKNIFDCDDKDILVDKIYSNLK